MMINLMYIFKVKVDSGEVIETMFNMRPYMPFDPIDFLTECAEPHSDESKTQSIK